MKFDDSFTVPVSRKEVWDALTDIERIYPALPGAELIEVKDNEFHGMVTMKLGPITAKYQGTAKFDSIDEEAGKLASVARSLLDEGPERTQAITRLQRLKAAKRDVFAPGSSARAAETFLEFLERC